MYILLDHNQKIIIFHAFVQFNQPYMCNKYRHLIKFFFFMFKMMTMEQTSLVNAIDSMLDHRSDASDANSVDSYV